MEPDCDSGYILLILIRHLGVQMKVAIIFAFALSVACVSLKVSAKQTILIIESYHSEFAWDNSYIRGLQSVFKDNYKVVYFQMDTKRLPAQQHQKQADLAWLEYQSLQPDLVVLGDDNALKYLGKKLSVTETPVVFLGINNNPRYYKLHHSKNITGVLERPLIKRSISKISHGKAQKILLLFDNSPTSQIIFEENFSKNKQIIISNIQVDIQLTSDFRLWKEYVTNSAEEHYDMLFIGLYHTLYGENSQHIPAQAVLDWTIQHTDIPPFAFWDFSVGKGKAIGGLVLFGFEQGKLAAEMATHILEMGIPAYQLRTQTGIKGRLLFSREQLKKFSITLPESINKKATFID